jgi:hypothetical protein
LRLKHRRTRAAEGQQPHNDLGDKR